MIKNDGFYEVHTHSHYGPFGMMPTHEWIVARIVNDTEAMSRMRLAATEWLRHN